MSNKNEGYIHVNSNQTLPIADYVSRLFPEMTSLQVQEAASVYEEYGTPVEQAIMAMGDCEPCNLLLKILGYTPFSSCSHLCLPDVQLARDIRGSFVEGQFAQSVSLWFDGRRRDSLLSYPRIMLKTFPTTSTGTPSSCPSHRILDALHSPVNSPPYKHRKLVFESIMSFAKYYDPNTKFDPTDITPHWDEYADGQTEMLFNRTEAGEAVAVPFETDPSLLRRCAYVFASLKTRCEDYDGDGFIGFGRRWRLRRRNDLIQVDKGWMCDAGVAGQLHCVYLFVNLFIAIITAYRS